MNRYPSYKATGISWLPDIPIHWECIRNKVFLIERKEKHIDSKGVLLSLSQYSGISKAIETENKTGMPTVEDLTNYACVKKNDLVMNIMLAWNGSTAASGYEGVISPAYAVFRIKNPIKVNCWFLDYLFRTNTYCNYFEAYSTGIIKSRLRLYPEKFNQLISLIPPKEEQDYIVQYLDWKTSEINQLINGYQKQITLLEEYLQKFIDQSITTGLNPSVCVKNTRAEWMGAVPIEWQEMRVKDICREKNVRSVDGKEPHLSMSQKKGLVTDNDDITRPFLSESYIGGKVCNENDLVLNRLKAHLGVFALAPQLGVVSPDYTVLEINTNRIVPKYAEYLLKCNSCRKELTTRVRGITEGFWRLYTEDLYSIHICIPSIAEQAKILSAIEKKEKLIKSSISMIQKEIDLITEYKKTLISNVVTGQVDVRDVEIPEFETVELTDTDSDVETETEG